MSMPFSEINDDFSVSSDHVITTPDLKIQPTTSLGPILFDRMKMHKIKIAQIDPISGKKDTFEELLQRSIRAAIHLKALGIGSDDIITLCTTNHLNTFVPFTSALFVGAKMASIDPSFSTDETTHLLNVIKPKLIFTISESVPTLEKVIFNLKLETKLVVFGASTQHLSFNDFLTSPGSEDDFAPNQVSLKETALIHFSSGTTGLPKGICLSHFALLSHLLNQGANGPLAGGKDNPLLKRLSFPLTTILATSPYWLSASTSFLSSALSGTCRLIIPKFNGPQIWNWISVYKPLILMVTPVQVLELINSRPSTAITARSLYLIIVIGSSLPRQYIDKLKDLFPESFVVSGYGQTEAVGAVTLFKPSNTKHFKFLSRKPDSIGLPTNGISYRVVDIDTNQNVGPNQKGELRIKSNYFMNGYYNRSSAETFDEEGYLKTGDIVYYDDDYCFYVIDRIKEAFKYQGWFIAPTYLEGKLMEHPAVKEAVVIGIPHDDGHHPMGLVVKDLDANVTELEIEKFVEERVSERQRLRAGVKFIDSIPLTVTGKVKRKELRDLILGQNLKQ